LLKKLISLCGASAVAFLSLPTAKATHQPAACSKASYYGHGDVYHGRTTANGERFNGYGISAAHRHFKFGTLLKVTNQLNNKTVVVRINDRGPFVPGREIDLSYGAFASISSPSVGVIPICYSKIA
jgi:rare lipoprotein A